MQSPIPVLPSSQSGGFRCECAGRRSKTAARCDDSERAERDATRRQAEPDLSRAPHVPPGDATRRRTYRRRWRVQRGNAMSKPARAPITRSVRSTARISPPAASANCAPKATPPKAAADASAAAMHGTRASIVQCRSVRACLSVLQRVGLHLSALQRPAPALHQVSASKRLRSSCMMCPCAMSCVVQEPRRALVRCA